MRRQSRAALESIVAPLLPVGRERLCPRCVWKPKTARTLLKSSYFIFNVCYWEPLAAIMWNRGGVRYAARELLLVGPLLFIFASSVLTACSGLVSLIATQCSHDLEGFCGGVKCGVDKGHEKTDTFVHLYSVVWSVAAFFFFFFTGKPILKPRCPLVLDSLILCMFIFDLSFAFSFRCHPHRSSSLVCSFLVVFSLHVFYATFIMRHCYVCQLDNSDCASHCVGCLLALWPRVLSSVVYYSDLFKAYTASNL